MLGGKSLLDEKVPFVSLEVNEHRRYLSDEVRVNAFRRAIEELVRPGEVVVDLGSGTGVLGLLACRAGALRVYCIESTGMIELARANCRANQFQDRMRFLKGHSTRIEMPEKADVVVCDQIGYFGFEAGVVQYLEDARARFLKPNGRLMPTRIEMFVAATESESIRDQVGFWNTSPAELNFSPAQKWAANTCYPVYLAAPELLSDGVLLASLDMHQASSDPFSADATITVSRAGVLDGIGGWFSAQLSPCCGDDQFAAGRQTY